MAQSPVQNTSSITENSSDISENRLVENLYAELKNEGIRNVERSSLDKRIDLNKSKTVVKLIADKRNSNTDRLDINTRQKASEENICDEKSAKFKRSNQNSAVLNCKLDQHIKSNDNSNGEGKENILNRLLGSRNESEIEICGMKCHALIDKG